MWNGFLALGGEEAFGFELGFELFEGQLQRSGAFGLDVFRRDLQFAAIFVDGDAPANDDLQAVGGTKTKQARGGAEHHDANLSVAVFEGEVEMSGLGGAEIRNFAFDPGIGIFAFDVGADGGDQVANLPYAAVGGAEVEVPIWSAREDTEGSVPQVNVRLSPHGTQRSTEESTSPPLLANAVFAMREKGGARAELG